MEDPGINWRGSWVLALLWVPTGLLAQAAVRFSSKPGAWLPTTLMAVDLGFRRHFGPVLALSCRLLWRLRYRRVAWAAGVGLGVATVVV